jgi:hypothetical protein
MSTEVCRHIRANGTRCGSPALRGRALCFFHHADRLRYPNRHHRQLDDTPTIIHSTLPDRDGLQRNPLVAEYAAPTQALALDFPPLEDRESIQVALSMLLSALARNQMEPKRAGLLLYGLQVASANAKSLIQNAADTVRDTVLDDTGLEIAPDQDPEQPEHPLVTLFRIAEELDEEAPARKPAPAVDSAHNSPESNTLPDPTP